MKVSFSLFFLLFVVCIYVCSSPRQLLPADFETIKGTIVLVGPISTSGHGDCFPLSIKGSARHFIVPANHDWTDEKTAAYRSLKPGDGVEMQIRAPKTSLNDDSEVPVCALRSGPRILNRVQDYIRWQEEDRRNGIVELLAFLAVCAALGFRRGKGAAKDDEKTFDREIVEKPKPSTREPTHVLTGDSFTENIERCYVLADLHKYAAAEDAAIELVAQYPDKADARLLLAELLMPEAKSNLLRSEREARNERALQLCKEAIALAPESANAHRTNARLLARQKLYIQAAKSIDEAIRLDPEYVSAMIDATNIYSHLKQTNKVLALCDAGLQLDPHNFALLNNKSLSMWTLGDLPAAARVLDLALAASPNAALAHYNRGLLAKDQGDHATALEHFKTALRLNPNDSGYLSCVVYDLPHLPIKVRIWWLLSLIFSGFSMTLRGWVCRLYPRARAKHNAVTIGLLAVQLIVVGSLVLWSALSRGIPLRNVGSSLASFGLVIFVSWMLSIVFRTLFIKAAQPFVAMELARDASANVKSSQ